MGEHASSANGNVRCVNIFVDAATRSKPRKNSVVASVVLTYWRAGGRTSACPESGAVCDTRLRCSS